MMRLKSLKIKKIVVFIQIFVLVIYVLKIVALAEMVQKTAPAPQIPNTANKQTNNLPVQDTSESKKSAGENELGKARDLYQSLEAQKGELDKKAQALKFEEQRLLILKKEILEKIDQLHIQEEKLNVALEANKKVDSQRYKDFAKVLESAPPAKAGQMLEQLDVQTAAGITMNMKKDKAGAVWGYLSPQKAVEITREVTRVRK